MYFITDFHCWLLHKWFLVIIVMEDENFLHLHLQLVITEYSSNLIYCRFAGFVPLLMIDLFLTMIPSVLTRAPVLAEEEQLHNMMLPPPCFMLNRFYFGLMQGLCHIFPYYSKRCVVVVDVFSALDASILKTDSRKTDKTTLL